MIEFNLILSIAAFALASFNSFILILEYKESKEREEYFKAKCESEKK